MWASRFAVRSVPFRERGSKIARYVLCFELKEEYKSFALKLIYVLCDLLMNE